MAKINEVQWEEGTTPANPATGYWKLYPKTDGFYYLEDDGTETGPLAASATVVDIQDITNVGTATAALYDVLTYATATSTWEPVPGVRGADGGLEQLGGTATSGTAYTVDLANGNVQDVTFSTACTLTFTGSAAGVACSFTLIARQDGTGNRAITWPAAVDWSGGSEPTGSTAANAVDVYTFMTVDNGTTWLGFQAGTAMA